MSVLEVPLVRWAVGLSSASVVAATGFVVFDGFERLVVYAVALVALVAEPLVLKRAMEQS
jgi:hypothetical protein